MLFFRSDCGRIFGNNTFYDSTMFVDNKYRKEHREISNKQNHSESNRTSGDASERVC